MQLGAQVPFKSRRPKFFPFRIETERRATSQEEIEDLLTVRATSILAVREGRLQAPDHTLYDREVNRVLIADAPAVVPPPTMHVIVGKLAAPMVGGRIY
jgi:hypothetical protein